MLFLFHDASQLEELIHDAVGQVVAESWSEIATLLHRQPKQVAIVTRTGVRLIANMHGVCIHARHDIIKASWPEVPALLASLRSALIPVPKKSHVEPVQAQTALEIASGFGGTQRKEEILFTVDDAEDICREYKTILPECPSRNIAGEIVHLQRVGPRKLFRYIDRAIIMS